MIRIVNALGKLNRGKRAYAVFVLCATTAIALSAQTFTTLHSFDRAEDGEDLYAGLVQATNGNLYGTTWLGGANNGGTVFEITPSGTLTTLYNFCSQTNCPDGSDLYAGLVQGTDGNFYGTTSAGGRDVSCNGKSGCGTIFKINSSGTLTTLYTFCPASPCTDGATPYGALVQGIDGNFYGTTEYGGIMGSGGLSGFGTIFKITPSGTLTTLHSFVGTDGANPYAALVQGADGNFYGTTSADGGSVYGTVFKITPSGTLTTLHSFVETDGRSPQSGLVQGTDGNFYGTTLYGGAQGSCRAATLCGTVFKITPTGTFTSLYSFCSESGCPDGADPYTRLIQGTDGNFYGTTESGGANGDGTIFKITPGGTLTTLYSFCSQAGCADGSEPYAVLIQATDGNLYGTTYEGGTNNDGTVFRLTIPAGSEAPVVTLVANAEGGNATIAANTWVEIKGSNLAPSGDTRIWQGSDFVNNQLPTQLDGVGVTMNGENAYVYYISPAQVNVLTPPNLASGSVQVKVTTGGVTSASFTAQAQPESLSFFIFGAGPYVVGTHLNGSDLGPTTLYNGLTTPAAPGELVILYANGFGPIAPPVVAGSEVQSGSLPSLPLIQIGGISASVQFAGLVSPGLYQFNVVVPSPVANGDNPITAQYNGLTTQSGVLLTVQQ
jgi:uncharacterized protein (TIGR03437 family)